MKRVLLTGGGTGGHLFPGIALANALSRLEIAQPVFLDHGKAMEQRILKDSGIERLSVSWGGSGGGVLAIANAFWRVPSALRLLKRERIDAVIALGAYPGVAPGIAGWIQGKPLFVLEQNRVMGKANRFLSVVARKLFLSVPLESSSRWIRARSAIQGCPIRESFQPADLPESEKPELLILGGSQGANAVNKVVLEVARHFRQPDLFRVHHVCGVGNEEGLEEAWKVAGVEARISAFLDDPAEAMTRCSLVVGRSGGSTIAELSSVGRPALLWPYPHHRDRHQEKNARYLEEKGAAIVFVDEEPRNIALRIEDLFLTAGKIAEMADCSKALGHPEASFRIAEMIAVHLGIEPTALAESMKTSGSSSEKEVMS